MIFHDGPCLMQTIWAVYPPECGHQKPMELVANYPHQNVSFIDMIELVGIGKPSRVNQGSRPCLFPRCQNRCSTNYCNWTDKTPRAQKRSYKARGKTQWECMAMTVWIYLSYLPFHWYLVIFGSICSSQWANDPTLHLSSTAADCPVAAMGCWIQLWSTQNWRCCTVSDWTSGWKWQNSLEGAPIGFGWIWDWKKGSRWW